MTTVLHISIKERDDRPSGHKISARFLRNAISHEETIGCPCEHEHALFLMRMLDVMAYDCGTRRGEFKEIPEVSAMMVELERVAKLIPREAAHD
jgi:hypothetical protein